MIKKKQLLAVTISFIVLSVFIQPADSASRSANGKPNFVVFLTDDQGWGDLGCYGHPLIQSPNLDKFARQGMRFTQCYAACSVCSPSRSSILTGRTPYRNGVWRWIPSGSQYHLRISEITVTQLLHDRGYATCHAGKWHLNGKFNSADQPQPNDHGYDWWLATQNNAAPAPFESDELRAKRQSPRTHRGDVFFDRRQRSRQLAEEQAATGQTIFHYHLDTRAAFAH